MEEESRRLQKHVSNVFSKKHPIGSAVMKRAL